MNVRFTALFLALVAIVLSPVLADATSPHHVYMGIFAGTDSRNSYGGGWDNDVAYSIDREMVQWQGRNFAFEETFMNADYNVDNIDALELITYQELEQIWYYGRVPMVNLNFGSHITCQQSLVQLDSALSDPYSVSYKGLVAWAKGLKRWFDLGQPSGVNNRYLFLAFLYEPNFSFCAVESDKSTWGYVDPDAFKSAYRKGRKIIEGVLGADYADRVHWFFAPANESNNFMPGFESYYPGDDVVDWMGLSAYNFGGYAKQGFTYPWQYFRDFAVPYLDRMRKLAPEKPLSLLQTGGISYGGDKNAWIVNFLNDAVLYPKLYLLIYFNAVVKEEAGYAPGFDWPVYWNDPYDARPYGFNVYLPQMRWTGWLDAIKKNSYLSFSPVQMPASGAFSSPAWPGIPWDIPHNIAPISNTYNLFPELGEKTGDSDGDGVANIDELAAGLDPLVKDVQTVETNCSDGIDNDANGRIDADDTVSCGDIPLAESTPRPDRGRKGEYRYFQFTVPAGTTAASVEVKDISGDVNLLVKKDGRPGLSLFDFQSSQNDPGAKKVSINNPSPGIWHILVYNIVESDYKIVVNNVSVVTPAISQATAAVSCDIDGNGQADIAFSIRNLGVQVYANNSKWMNLSVAGVSPSLIVCSDVTGDGKKELVGIWNSPGAMKYFDISAWSWKQIATPGALPDVVKSGDMDGDGKDDLIGIFGSLNSVKYRSSKTGLWNDIALKGLPVPDDIFVANMDAIPGNEIVGVFRTIQAIKNYQNGLWSDVATPNTSMPDSVAVGDIDSDGIGDIVCVWKTTNPHSMYVRSGFTGEWRDIRTATSNTVDSMPARIYMGDVDGDRKEDIISLWDTWHQIQIFRQIWFGWMIVYDDPVPDIVVVGNFDGDSAGRNDVGMIWSDGSFRIWMNNRELIDVPVDVALSSDRFCDVPQNYWAYSFIDQFAASGITTGCRPDDPNTTVNEAMYCPDDIVTRAQMAIFLTRALNAAVGVCTGAMFGDVNALTVGDSFCRYIEKFSTLGITSGCGNGNFCPDPPVTRGQMAVFLTKALGLTPAAVCTGKVFGDVSAATVGDGFCRYIENFATLGITSGCGNGNYCPDEQVTRAQMAVFLSKAFLQ